jgi:hypothetical protein
MKSRLENPCMKYGLKKLNRHTSIHTFSQGRPLELGDTNTNASEVSCLFDYSELVSGNLYWQNFYMVREI